MESMKPLGAKALTEFLGTGILCLTITLSGSGEAIGSVLMAMIYMGGHVSGASYNPAVNVGLAIRGKLAPLELAVYTIAQLAGGLAFGALAKLWKEDAIGYPAYNRSFDAGKTLGCEIILTFALMHTILHVATSKAQANNNYYGLAIGLVVLSGAGSVGPISGGAFNPAVSMLNLVAGEPDDIWIYWVGPIVGAAIAAVLFRFTHPQECDDKIPFKGNELTRKGAPYVIEFVGTFLLAFTIAIGGDGYRIGAILVSQVYAGGATSGAVYNPAVAVGLLARFFTAGEGAACKRLREHFTIKRFFIFVIVEMVAGVAAALVAKLIFWDVGDVNGPYPGDGVSVPEAFIAEIVGTFVLVIVILNVATAGSNANNHYFGLAIGYTVRAMAGAFGPISGGAFNPAVATLRLFSDKDSPDVWIYFLACPIGGLIAGFVFRLQNYEEFASTPMLPSYHKFADYDVEKSKHHAFHCDHGQASEKDNMIPPTTIGMPASMHQNE